MATLTEMRLRFESLQLEQSVPVIIQEQEAVLVNYNQDQLFSLSQDADGKPLQEYRSEEYAKEKNRRNPGPGLYNPDLYDTGDFYRGFRADVDSKTIDMKSDDAKASSLMEQYGNRIMGLSPQSKSRYSKGEFFTAFKKYVEGKTKLKFT